MRYAIAARANICAQGLRQCINRKFSRSFRLAQEAAGVKRLAMVADSVFPCKLRLQVPCDARHRPNPQTQLGVQTCRGGLRRDAAFDPHRRREETCSAASVNLAYSREIACPQLRWPFISGHQLSSVPLTLRQPRSFQSCDLHGAHARYIHMHALSCY